MDILTLIDAIERRVSNYRQLEQENYKLRQQLTVATLTINALQAENKQDDAAISEYRAQFNQLVASKTRLEELANSLNITPGVESI
jgi:DNA repair exonuclease SbcCD ATPase subunit